jgi:hypothetical protein
MMIDAHPSNPREAASQDPTLKHLTGLRTADGEQDGPLIETAAGAWSDPPASAWSGDWYETAMDSPCL